MEGKIEGGFTLVLGWNWIHLELLGNMEHLDLH